MLSFYVQVTPKSCWFGVVPKGMLLVCGRFKQYLKDPNGHSQSPWVYRGRPSKNADFIWVAYLNCSETSSPFFTSALPNEEED